jgi:threonine aldolase
MILFTNDYTEGCHPAILEALARTNLLQQVGYGFDEFSAQAIELLRAQLGNPAADVHFVHGGTMANLLVLNAFLKSYESVIAAQTGHIFVHEAGAIEATGHKIEVATTPDGKLRPEDVAPLLQKSPPYHTVKPRVVYISNSTEIGTTYTKDELTALSEYCRANGLLLYLDGARLPMALAATPDLTLADIAQLTDAFYLGGTKCGALLGEAIVINNPALQPDFKYHLKQRGALLAKGRVLGVQFATLLQDGLLFELAAHANAMAQKIARVVQGLGYHLLTVSETNQIFPILPNSVIDQLKNEFGFYVWKQVDAQQSAIRLITSWATPEEAVDQFIAALRTAHSQAR